MAKANNQFERWASEAAARMDRAHAAGEQLNLLPPEPDAGAVLAEGGGRGKGKTGSQLRAMLAARGLRMPEDVLAEMAGLASSQDAFVTAMQRTEQLMAWAYGDAAVEAQLDAKNKLALGSARVALFQQLYAAQLRALDALMPYGLAKVSGDGAPQQVVQVVVAGAQPAPATPASGPATARDVTPQARRIAPPPMPHEMQQNQRVAEGRGTSADADRRTE